MKQQFIVRCLAVAGVSCLAFFLIVAYFPGLLLSADAYKLSKIVGLVFTDLIYKKTIFAFFLLGVAFLLVYFAAWILSPPFSGSEVSTEHFDSEMHSEDEKRAQSRLQELATSIRDKEEQIFRLKEEVSQLKQKTENGSTEALAVVRADLERSQSTIQSLTEEAERFRRELEEKTQETEKLKAQETSVASEELNQLKSRAEELESKLNEERMFVGTVTHEIKNPLSVVIGYVSLLLKRWAGLPEERKVSYLEIVENEMNRLSRLVNGLLELTRIQQGRVTLNVVQLDLLTLVHRVLEPLQSQTKNVFLAIQFPPKSISIQADEDRLKQVFLNLIGNALKYTPPSGKIIVEAKETPEGVEVSITNEGPPIPQEAISKLFGKFYRVDSEINRKVPGTGLGLSVCKAIVELHGGRIWADPSYQKGARLVFVLPYTPPRVPLPAK